MRRVALILAVATREEINQWTRRHRGRREITRTRARRRGSRSKDHGSYFPYTVADLDARGGFQGIFDMYRASVRHYKESAAEIAELSVWALKKALHVAEIDTALMEDITFAFINGLYMKLRGGE